MLKIFGLVVQTEKHYREHIPEDTKEAWKIKGLVDDLTAENAGLKQEIVSDRKAKTKMMDTIREFRDLELSERIGHLIKSLQERNTAVGAANLDIVVTGPMTTYGVIEDLRKLLDGWEFAK